MSVKVLIQNESGLPSWALRELLLIVRQFRCHASLLSGETVIDGKKMLQVISVIKTGLSKVELRLEGEDEGKALACILHSKMGRFISKDQ